MSAETQVWANVLWVVMGIGLMAYAVTGGADLGVGVWSLLASGPRKEQQREALRKAIAPIWEVNHIWLIFLIVVMFSAFSRAFAAISVALHIPLGLALIGIVLRGSAYVFHAYGIQRERSRADWDRVFAWASCVTPLFLGLVVGGVSSGQIRIAGGQVTSGFFAGWTSPFAASVGFFSLALFAMLSAVYLAADTQGELRDDFRRRALGMQVVAAAFAGATFLLAGRYAPLFHRNLTESPWTGWLQLMTASAALGTIALLILRSVAWARVTAAALVASVVLGWGLGMRGHFMISEMPLERSIPNPEVLKPLVIALSIGSILLIPALGYLFWVFKRRA